MGDQSERVTIFIDGANLMHALSQDFGKINIDFEILARKLVMDRKLVRVYYYTALPDQAKDPERYSKQQKFCEALRRKPYFSITYGRLEMRPTGYVEKGVDIALAVDMLRMAYANTYDTAIVVSGDGDFACAVEAVQFLGKHVENASTRGSLSRHLQQTCDVTTMIDNGFLADCWRDKR